MRKQKILKVDQIAIDRDKISMLVPKSEAEKFFAFVRRPISIAFSGWNTPLGEFDEMGGMCMTSRGDISEYSLTYDGDIHFGFNTGDSPPIFIDHGAECEFFPGDKGDLTTIECKAIVHREPKIR